MLGLPKSTELSKQLPKKAIYEKFNMNTAAKEKFDADVSRISIAAEISPTTTSIAKGEEVSSIYVLFVTLKNKDYDERTVSSLFKLIDQHLVLVLDFEGEQRLAIYHTKLIQGPWANSNDLKITLKGLNFDSVWENIVKSIGEITITDGNTLDEQIVADEQKEKLLKEIARLERQARNEKQPKKKFELVQEIKKLKARSNNE